jgi:hypothetical protein
MLSSLTRQLALLWLLPVAALAGGLALGSAGLVALGTGLLAGLSLSGSI